MYKTLIKEGMSDKEIETAIKQKKREFGGFMTIQGMLFLIAKENGILVGNPNLDLEFYDSVEEEIDYNEFTIPISDLKEGMVNIIILGKIMRSFRILEFARNDGSIGIVGSFILQDGSGSIKIIAWDDKVKPLQSEFFQDGSIVRVIGGYSKIGREGELEVHVGWKGKLILSPENISSEKRDELDSLKVQTKIKTKPNKSSVPLSLLMNENQFIPNVEGIIHVEEFKELKLKSGESTFLLKLLLTDEHENSASIVIWAESALNVIKSIEEGNAYQFRNIMVKDNSYTGEKELVFTRRSSLNPA